MHWNLLHQDATLQRHPATTAYVGQEDSGLPPGSPEALQQLLRAPHQKELQIREGAMDPIRPNIHGKTP